MMMRCGLCMKSENIFPVFSVEFEQIVKQARDFYSCPIDVTADTSNTHGSGSVKHKPRSETMKRQASQVVCKASKQGNAVRERQAAIRSLVDSLGWDAAMQDPTYGHIIEAMREDQKRYESTIG